jgi:CHAT domain-containing protein
LQQGANRGKEDVVEEQTAALSAEYEKVQAQIRTASQNYGALRLPSPLTIREAQQLLDPDTTLLEFGLGDERSFVWAITAQSVASFELPPRAKIETAARRLYSLLTVRNELTNESGLSRQQRIVQANKDYLNAASELSEMLFTPLYQTLNCKRIIVVADGALQYIPFAALPSPQTEWRKEPEFDTASNSIAAKYEVINLPSVGVLAVQRREFGNRPVSPDAIAVFGDPVFDNYDSRVLAPRRSTKIPKKSTVSQTASSLSRSLRDVGLNTSVGIPRLLFSRQEATAIFSLSRNPDSIKILDFTASRTNLIGMDLSRFRNLHFATHGLVNNEHPELSGILLSLVDERGARQDGFLTLQEIYRLNLRADLVVLSACQTAIGKNIRGEGLLGLTRGFMYAGASSVVGSLWKVDDSATAALMAEFYKEMFTNGKRPAAALRDAQMSISKQKRWQSPYYWAGFVLQGDWR